MELDDAGPEPRLVDGYDTLLLDLDGVVYTGADAVPGAVEAISGALAAGLRVAYVTNNASRTPDEVAGHLAALGLPADAADVVTSAQAAASLLAARMERGAGVVVVGGDGLREALEEVGLRPVSEPTEGAAVVQGFSPDLTWRDLARGADAVRRGLLWVATNLDATVPTPAGPAPGNGTMVAAVQAAAGRAPDLVAGKPARALVDEARTRTGARRPLVVGDRLDTDLAGALAAGLDGVLVLTGVDGPEQALAAPPEQRPRYVVAGLGGLLAPCPAPELDDGWWRCGVARARRVSGRLEVEGGDPLQARRGPEHLDALRAACAATWGEGQTRRASGGLPADG